ncbi:MAG TPA: DUF4375 domain-containing protein [Haloferula sp.]
MQVTGSAEKWGTLTQYWVRHDFEKLPLHHREMAAAYFLDSEIQNGGFDQYFFNRGYGQVAAAKKAMKRLGAESQLLLLDQAIGRVEASHGPIGKISFEQARKIEMLELDDLDSKYYRVSPALTDLVEAEVLKNYERYQPAR